MAISDSRENARKISFNNEGDTDVEMLSGPFRRHINDDREERHKNMRLEDNNQRDAYRARSNYSMIPPSP